MFLCRGRHSSGHEVLWLWFFMLREHIILRLRFSGGITKWYRKVGLGTLSHRRF
jgi:hypothetical protein